MIDYTPHHQYKEIVDYIPPKENVLKSKIRGFCLLFLYLAIVGWMFNSLFQLKSTIWSFLYDCIGIGFLALIIGVVFVLVYALFSPGKPRLRENYASVIKTVIGFDWGDDYMLLYTGSHDYEEYLYVFTKESFKPLKKYLESMKDGEQEDSSRYVQHRYIDSTGNERAGFSLIENRLGDDVCGNIESIEVDYEERTLKHKFVVY